MNKKRIILITFLALVLLVSACAAKDETASMEPSVAYDMVDAEEQTTYTQAESGEMYYGDDKSYDTNSSDADGTDAVEFSEKIIYNAYMNVVSDDPVATANDIEDKVTQMGGYVSSSYVNNYSETSIYVNMQVRVPSKGFTSMMDYISSISEVEYQNKYTDNITESYYDTVARLENKKLEAEQYKALLDRAESIEDILAITEKLSEVQEDIEVYEGRLRMWDSLVDYSTIDISISPTPTIDTDGNKLRLITLGETGRGIARAFNNSLIFIANFFSFLVRLLAALLIPALIVVPIVIIIVRISKKSRAKRKENQSNVQK